ncbi:hypothetical protein GIB67_026745 [Kingdonia uniflora]|uniref:Fe2OG dioxygenase domain-containing protein n=1 Tax=Kingdonia uniflora TaxID=39325 RepID=A0A7J7MH96_9MAGN|nr:hypothetical protein GIB67_026745 [Kingdonia uniflora]
MEREALVRRVIILRLDSERRTPLHWAVDRGHFDMVDLLLRKDADVNAKACKEHVFNSGTLYSRLRLRLRLRLRIEVVTFSLGIFDGVTLPKIDTFSSHQNKSSGASSTVSDTLPSDFGKSHVMSDEASTSSSSASVNSRAPSLPRDELSLPLDQSEVIRCSQVGRKKDFEEFERVNGKLVNVVKGLELHTKVFDTSEQKKIVDCVYDLQRMGQLGKLRRKSYSEPRKWMRGKGRVTIQFGCCYNYAVDKNGNPPGISRDEEVDPIPPMFKAMIKRLVRWHIIPPSCIPNSCIVNIYEEGDCIPPHIDHHDFIRPFCTVSFLAEANILFGSNLKILSPGEFSGTLAIPLPLGSVLVLKGNGSDVAKHCVPAVPAKRISITFRKMDDTKLPYKYLPDPELQNIQPLGKSSLSRTPVSQVQVQSRQLQQVQQILRINQSNSTSTSTCPSPFENDDFPPLGGQSSATRPRSKRM